MSQCFAKPYRSFVKLDLSSYATKAEWKNTAGVDTSKLTSKSNLAGLKAEADKIDVHKLKTVLVDLIKLSNVVNNEVVKKKICIIFCC